MMILNIDCIFASLLILAKHLKWLISTDSNKCLLVIKCSLISHFMCYRVQDVSTVGTCIAAPYKVQSFDSAYRVTN